MCRPTATLVSLPEVCIPRNHVARWCYGGLWWHARPQQLRPGESAEVHGAKGRYSCPPLAVFAGAVDSLSTPGPPGLLAPSIRSILRIHGTTRPPTTRLPPVADCAEPRPTAPRPSPLSHHCCSRPSHSLACLTANSLPVFRVPEETPGCARKHSTHPSLPQARVLHNTPRRSSARPPDFTRDRSLFPLPDRHPPKRHRPSDSRLPIFTSTYPSHAAISAHPLVHLRHPIATALDAFVFALASARRASVCTSMSAVQV